MSHPIQALGVINGPKASIEFAVGVNKILTKIM